MEYLKAVITVPVLPWVKKFIFTKHSDLIINQRYLDLRKPKVIYGIPSIIRVIGTAKLTKFANSASQLNKEKIEIVLPDSYSKFGFLESDCREIGRCINELCRSELVIICQNLSSLPLMSRESAIKITLGFFGISDNEYDFEHFRRNFDRYSIKASGKDFHNYRSKLTSFIIRFYLNHLELHSKNPDFIKKKIERLQENLPNELSKFN